MWRYFLILVLSVFLVGCEFDEETQPINEPEEVVEETMDEQDIDVFPGSVVVTGEKAQKVIANMEDDFWLSDTGVLHNSLCRWYKKCSGKVWDRYSAFTNCKNCGGAEPIVREWNIKDGEE